MEVEAAKSSNGQSGRLPASKRSKNEETQLRGRGSRLLAGIPRDLGNYANSGKKQGELFFDIAVVTINTDCAFSKRPLPSLLVDQRP